MAAARCYGCMRTKTQHPLCEHCGYNENIDNLPHQLPLGTFLDNRYELGKVLGQGGFGITYIGWDHKKQIPVAIKELYLTGMHSRDTGLTHSVLLNNQKDANAFARYKQKFLQEASILAELRRIPGIVNIYRLFEMNGTVYIVMEYLSGLDLRMYLKLKAAPLSVEETFAIMRPLMAALHRLHEAKLIHRDISPDNIKLTGRGGVKLMDFGAAREVLYADPDRPMSHSTDAIVKHGFAPMEQYQRKGTLGPWTDVYALAATMYYCLTGTVPPDAPRRIIDGVDVPWNKIPGLKRHEAYALAKAMAPIPKDRIQSVEKLGDVLFGIGWLDPDPIPVPVPDPKPPVPREKRWEKWLHVLKGKMKGRGKAMIALALAAVVLLGSVLVLGRDSGIPDTIDPAVFEGTADLAIHFEDGSRTEIFLDGRGREVGRIFQNENRETEFRFTAEYKENGDILYQNTFDGEDNLLRSEVYSYNREGLLEEHRILENGKTVYRTITYTYTDSGELSRLVTRDGKGNVTSETVWEFDASGRKVSSRQENEDGTAVEKTYDSNGNEKYAHYLNKDGMLEQAVEFVQYLALQGREIPETRGGWSTCSDTGGDTYDGGTTGGNTGGDTGSGGNTGSSGASSPAPPADSGNTDSNNGGNQGGNTGGDTGGNTSGGSEGSTGAGGGSGNSGGSGGSGNPGTKPPESGGSGGIKYIEETEENTEPNTEFATEEPSEETTEPEETAAQDVQPDFVGVKWVCVEKRYYDSEGTMTRIHKMEYDANGRKIKEVEFDGDNVLQCRTEYTYTPHNGELESQVTHYSFGSECILQYMTDIRGRIFRSYFDWRDGVNGYTNFDAMGNLVE